MGLMMKSRLTRTIAKSDILNRLSDKSVMQLGFDLAKFPANFKCIATFVVHGKSTCMAETSQLRH